MVYPFVGAVLVENNLEKMAVTVTLKTCRICMTVENMVVKVGPPEKATKEAVMLIEIETCNGRSVVVHEEQI